MSKMAKFSFLALGVAVFVVGGCPAPNASTNTGTGDTVVSGDKDENTNVSDDNGTNSGDGLSVGGKLNLPVSAKVRPRAQDKGTGWQVVAVNEDGTIYRGDVDSSGEFQLDISKEDQDKVFSITILDAAGRAAGTVQYGHDGDTGFTGLNLSESVDLGTMTVPDDPSNGPIESGNADKTDKMIAADVTARLDGNGVPVGQPNLGKGTAANGQVTSNPHQSFDQDQDGLPDFVDADNDGDGIIDDSDNDHADSLPDGLTINFFMNLKIGQQDSATYYGGDATQIADRLTTDTVITYEVFSNAGGGGGAGKSPAIKGVHLHETPGPAYLATAMANTGPGTFGLWSDDDFSFTYNAGTQRFERFVVPHDAMNAGDSFVVEVEFEDGTTSTFSRMINFVFKNIPKLVATGTPSSTAAYAGGNVSFDGTQDVVLEFKPPVDDTGAYLTGLNYFLEVFYQDSGGQINGIDVTSTFGSTPPKGFQGSRTVYELTADELGALSGDNTYTVTLPKEIFASTVQTSSGSSTVTGYQIDIAAQNNGGNAAIKLNFEKH